jgi:heat shock protein HslJ
MSRMIIRTLAVCLIVFAAGCRPAANKPTAESPQSTTPVTQPATAPTITDIDWNLVGLGEQSHPLGAGGKQVTLRLDAASGRAAGFGGCNRYSGSYTLRGDSLSFGAVMATKMACPDGMELEAAWHRTLPTVATFAATETTLTLNAAKGPVAWFRK